MKIPARVSRRSLAAAALAAVTAACSSGGDGHTPPPPPPPPVDDCTLAPVIPAGQPFTVSGTVTYDFVPATYSPTTGSGGLNFAASTQKPVREADVEIRQCGNVLATTATDTVGHYSATFTPAATGRVSVYVLARSANPPIRVQDNTDGDALWAVGQPITSTSPTLDVRATHGWTGSGYGTSRIAAPFAILDSMYTAAHRLLDLPRTIAFPPLAVNWSPSNYPSSFYDLSSGAIVTSHYDPASSAISILGAAGTDTDEFDREVIVHEWSHYFEDNLSRSDSIGGSHGFGYVLDPRVAFGEGYASAFAAILLQQTIYADTYWAYGAQDAFGWDVETVPAPTDDPTPGPFSELSIIRAMWDLYDSGANEPSYDSAAVGLGPIYDTLVGPEKVTPALTTLASFITGLKVQAGVSATAVNGVLAHYGIGPITSDWGDGDTSLRAIYADVPAPSATAFSRTASLNGTYYDNERPQNQYYVFTAAGSSATVTSACPYDVDLYAYQSGTLLAVAWSTTGYETISFATTPGQIYVVVLNGWGGAPSGQSGVGNYSATVTFSSP